MGDQFGVEASFHFVTVMNGYFVPWREKFYIRGQKTVVQAHAITRPCMICYRGLDQPCYDANSLHLTDLCHIRSTYDPIC